MKESKSEGFLKNQTLTRPFVVGSWVDPCWAHMKKSESGSESE
jgi:hypothetical protein